MGDPDGVAGGVSKGGTPLGTMCKEKVRSIFCLHMQRASESSKFG
jgi:hypothetical protein